MFFLSGHVQEAYVPRCIGEYVDKVWQKRPFTKQHYQCVYFAPFPQFEGKNALIFLPLVGYFRIFVRLFAILMKFLLFRDLLHYIIPEENSSGGNSISSPSPY